MISLSYAMGGLNSALLLGRLIEPLGLRFVVAEVVGNCSREERTGRASYCDERTVRAARNQTGSWVRCANLAAIRAGDMEQGSIGMDEGRAQKRRVRAMRRQRARRL